MMSLVLSLVLSSAVRSGDPSDRVFTANIDQSEQRYVEWLPEGFDPSQPHDVVLALHGHGSDRWQFIRDPRDECRGVREMTLQSGRILISPDYRAKTSWLGPKAEADLVQIISELKQRYQVNRVFLAGGSMGGTAVLTFTVLHPELVDGVCSLNGTANLVEYDQFQDAIQESFGGTKQEVPEEYRRRSAEYFPERFQVPIACTTGGQDALVPPDSVLRLLNSLRERQVPVLSLHRPAGGHSTNYDDTCTAMRFMFDQAAKD